MLKKIEGIIISETNYGETSKIINIFTKDGIIGAIAKGKWSKNKVFEVAKNCETKTEFKKKYRGAYEKAFNNGWLSEMNWFVNGHVKWAKEKRIAEKLSKPVLQIDKTTNEIIKEFPSIKDAEMYLGVRNSNISMCCKNKPNYNTAYGFKWKYKEESVA